MRTGLELITQIIEIGGRPGSFYRIELEPLGHGSNRPHSGKPANHTTILYAVYISSLSTHSQKNAHLVSHSKATYS